jgi:hypothetical protein
MATDTQSRSSKLARQNIGFIVWVLLNLILAQNTAAYAELLKPQTGASV